ncbi:MAG: (2Fe-2S)-binding protein [Synergistes jonesii]|uniref:(2Fe-2S)-binding protein n=1 Tax=Synergistes jonesii TaxID=2754 RepID=UPI002A74832B|nr:(2Fe-2S)-binding protein [Synergistes jonesii]MDY2984795.1 (2Fe-2S)-binding protein [Synergistes jonesii]
MIKKTVTLTLNGSTIVREVPVNHTMLDFLRDDLKLTGTKCGCGAGECGSCTILVNGEPVNSCLMLAADADGKEVTTIEGLSRDGDLHPLQKAFLAYGAIQCGYCTPGMILSSKALLERNPHPTIDEVKKALSGNICRCTGYDKIFKAVMSVANGEILDDPVDGVWLQDDLPPRRCEEHKQ